MKLGVYIQLVSSKIHCRYCLCLPGASWKCEDSTSLQVFRAMCSTRKGTLYHRYID